MNLACACGSIEAGVAARPCPVPRQSRTTHAPAASAGRRARCPRPWPSAGAPLRASRSSSRKCRRPAGSERISPFITWSMASSRDNARSSRSAASATPVERQDAATCSPGTRTRRLAIPSHTGPASAVASASSTVMVADGWPARRGPLVTALEHAIEHQRERLVPGRGHSRRQLETAHDENHQCRHSKCEAQGCGHDRPGEDRLLHRQSRTVIDSGSARGPWLRPVIVQRRASAGDDAAEMSSRMAMIRRAGAAAPARFMPHLRSEVTEQRWHELAEGTATLVTAGSAGVDHPVHVRRAHGGPRYANPSVAHGSTSGTRPRPAAPRSRGGRGQVGCAIATRWQRSRPFDM